jgi:hypothetical protein
MNIEGVLTEGAPESNILNYEASGPGRVLYKMLCDSSRIVLLSMDHSKDRVKAWLARERMTRYADIHCYPPESILSPAEWRIQHLKDLMGIGHHISFYIDSDPTAVAAAMQSGIGALLVGYSGITPGHSDHNGSYSPWYDLVDTIEKQNLLRATKALENDQDG